MLFANIAEGNFGKVYLITVSCASITYFKHFVGLCLNCKPIPPKNINNSELNTQALSTQQNHKNPNNINQTGENPKYI